MVSRILMINEIILRFIEDLQLSVRAVTYAHNMSVTLATMSSCRACGRGIFCPLACKHTSHVKKNMGHGSGKESFVVLRQHVVAISKGVQKRELNSLWLAGNL